MAVCAEIDRLRRPTSVGSPGLPLASKQARESLRQEVDAAPAVVAELRAENHHLSGAVARKLGRQLGAMATPGQEPNWQPSALWHWWQR